MIKEIKEPKKITAGLIFSWIFGVLFLFSGLGMVMQGSLFSGIIIVICSAMIIPYFNRLSEENFNFKITGGVKFILVIIILVFMGIGMSNSEDLNSNQDIVESDDINTPAKESKTQTYSLNEKIILDNFEYTFTNVQESSKVGNEYLGDDASGVFVIIDVEVKNIGNEADYINNEIYILDNQGREFEQDDDAWIYLDDNFIFEELNPGLTKKGQIIFDIPKDIERKIGIKKSMWSSDFSAYVSL